MTTDYQPYGVKFTGWTRLGGLSLLLLPPAGAVPIKRERQSGSGLIVLGRETAADQRGDQSLGSVADQLTVGSRCRDRSRARRRGNLFHTYVIKVCIMSPCSEPESSE